LAEPRSARPPPNVLSAHGQRGVRSRPAQWRIVLVVSGSLPAAAKDLSEPISPELVLVCPELREFALANAREFPAPQPFRPPPIGARAPDRPERTPKRRKSGRKPVFAAAVVVTAIAVGPAFTAGDRPQLERSRPQRAAGPDRVAGVSVTQRPERNLSKPRTANVKDAPARRAKRRSRDRPRVSRRVVLELERKAERNVLRSPRFFLARGGAAAALVDRATKLFRANTTSRCTVTKRRRNGSWEGMCRVRRGSVSIRVRYVATGRSSFRLASLAAAP
jgi:hypothetical protein